MLIIRRDMSLINPHRNKIQSITKILNVSSHKLVKKKEERGKSISKSIRNKSKRH